MMFRSTSVAVVVIVTVLRDLVVVLWCRRASIPVCTVGSGRLIRVVALRLVSRTAMSLESGRTYWWCCAVCVATSVRGLRRRVVVSGVRWPLPVLIVEVTHGVDLWSTGHVRNNVLA